MFRFTPALAAGALLLGALPASAQDRLARSVDAVSGKQLRLAIIGNVTKECTVGPAPEVKIATPPKNGQLAVRSGKAKVARCPNLEAPVQGVFYQASASFTGTDEISYEVKQPNGRSQIVTVRINVSAQEKPGAKPDAKPGAKPDVLDL